MKICFIDCESTGTDPQQHGLIQLAGKIYVNGVRQRAFDIRTKPFPDDVIDAEAMAVNGITPAEMALFLHPSVAYRKFCEMLSLSCNKFQKVDKYFFVGYNGDFDANMVRGWFTKNNDKYFGSWFWWPVLDVAKLAGIRLMDVRHTMADFKLKTVAREMGIPIDPTRLHDAAYDIDLTMEMFRILTEDLPALKFLRGTA